MFEFLVQNGMAESYTATCRGEFLVMWGATRLNPHTCELWCLTSEWFRDNATDGMRFLMTRVALRFIRSLHLSGAVRLQMIVNMDFERAAEWARFLGFRQEGILSRYGPGQEDVYMFGKIG